MTNNHSRSATRVAEIEAGVFQIHTPVGGGAQGFSFNQYLILDDEPLLFHTGPRALGSCVIEAIGRVLPLERLRWISFGHVESDECGALNQLLAAAPEAQPVCSHIGALVSVNDLSDRPARSLRDGEVLSTGQRSWTWLDAPHVPHGWDNGFLFEAARALLLCGDLFTQPGAEHAPFTENDILEPSEAMRRGLDYYAHAPQTAFELQRLAALNPQILACMHGSAWRGDASQLLRELVQRLSATA